MHKVAKVAKARAVGGQPRVDRKIKHGNIAFGIERISFGPTETKARSLTFMQ